jgi:hypothetical protein
VPRSHNILIGPRTTVFALLEAYPFLESFLLARDGGFEALGDARARTRWARIMALDDIAVRLDVTWRQLVREIAAEVERITGRPARVADAPRRIADDERRLGELRDIVAGLENGAPLPEMAARWRDATADLEQAESAALDAALSRIAVTDREHAVRLVREGAGEHGGAPASLPAWHPLQSLRSEAGRIRQLSHEATLAAGSAARLPPRRPSLGCRVAVPS